jgi:hypothetical protein
VIPSEESSPFKYEEIEHELIGGDVDKLRAKAEQWVTQREDHDRWEWSLSIDDHYSYPNMFTATIRGARK